MNWDERGQNQLGSINEQFGFGPNLIALHEPHHWSYQLTSLYIARHDILFLFFPHSMLSILYQNFFHYQGSNPETLINIGHTRSQILFIPSNSLCWYLFGHEASMEGEKTTGTMWKDDNNYWVFQLFLARQNGLTNC